MALSRVAVVVLSAVALAGCAASPSPAESPGPAAEATTPTASSMPRATNPVALLRRVTGCRLDSDAAVGNELPDGARRASCAFHNNGTADSPTPGTQVDLRTVVGDPVEIYPDETRPQDDRPVIVGDGWFAVVIAPSDYRVKVRVADVAAQLGGKVVTPTD